VPGLRDERARVTRRRLPRWSELSTLLRPRRFELDPTDRRLARAATIDDLRAIARKRTPRAVFDYADGAAEREIGLRRSREAFSRVELVPTALHDVSNVDTSTTILGRRAALPLAFAPTGFTRLFHHEGERAVLRVAEREGIPASLSTVGTTTIEALAAEAPAAAKWFQLYVWRDRSASAALVERAKAAGYEALLFTVDVPVAGSRLRDVHNGLVFPPELTARTLAGIARHPAWWLNVLTTDPLRFAMIEEDLRTVARVADHLFDAALTTADVTWLRELWDGPLVVKGILTAEDARRAVDLGADGVVVSSHGSRQLDLSPTPLEALPAVVDAVGDRAEVLLDSGITSGADVVAAVAMGARACLVARSYCYGLMAGGERGVQRAAEILRTEIVRTMALLGTGSVSDLTPQRVRLRP
jgi:L-lactate dehydrogenase (cytochrome)